MWEKVAMAIVTSEWFMVAVIGLAVKMLASWLLTATGLKWRKYEGWAISAVKAVEKAIPDDTPNAGLARFNRALLILLDKYRAVTGKEPDTEAVAGLENLINVVHQRLEAEEAL